MNFVWWQWALAMVLDFFMRTGVVYMLRGLMIDIPSIRTSLLPALVWTMFHFICLAFAGWCVRVRDDVLRCMYTLVLANALQVGLVAALSASGTVTSTPADAAFFYLMVMVFFVWVVISSLPIALAGFAGWVVRRLAD